MEFQAHETVPSLSRDEEVANSVSEVNLLMQCIFVSQPVQLYKYNCLRNSVQRETPLTVLERGCKPGQRDTKGLSMLHTNYFLQHLPTS